MYMMGEYKSSVRSADEILHDLAGAFWRLEKYRYIQPAALGDEVAESERDHWLGIARGCVDEARQIAKKAVAMGECNKPGEGE
jgi:hypothetical protein